ncbi:hypothetical protein EZ456_21915 [Pedobacter psychrodurus]|uniref:PH (Pleckstrin Homology) domain-containing protein n=1 Tax=Pedobacter psychrodurus TaxID=2530456 RepID=A0A4R0PGR7_9SPHI|nr:hypothetical protein [Pedobacter psychrodurus]TCD18102.1 hypothetical protein EZ456_21915 [Pedobacter psychrodurus]
MEFKEKQSLKLWWLYVLLAIDAVLVLSIVLFDKGGMNFETLKANYFAPFWAVFLPFAIIYLLQKNMMTLQIGAEGISYKYFPFQSKLKLLSWINIEKVYINKYNALGDYGGFGVRSRLWFRFNDKAYLLNDKDKGLQIEFKNGKKLLFSSNKIDELEMFLINLKTKYNIQAIQ